MKLSLAQLSSVVASYVASNKISVATFEETRANTVGLLDKIGKIFTIDTSYEDKLTMFEGEYLSFGKTIEEWQEDLILPSDYDASGDNALAPADGTYRPVYYSYTLGRKKVKITIRNNDIERAVHNIEQFNSIITMKTKRMYDSIAVWRYGVKREMLAKLIALCEATESTSSSVFSASGTYAVDKLLKSAVSSPKFGIVVKPYTSGDASNWADAVAKGFIIEQHLVETIAVPSSTETGEAFVKQLKKDVEVASDLSEGHSLSGNTLGATQSLVLLVKQGIMPEIEVDVLAGAFHTDKVSVPAEVKVIKDFGSNATGVFAMLVDSRALRLHNTYRAVREQQNGEGDFLNMVYHSEDTAFISRNTFVKVYKAAQ